VAAREEIGAVEEMFADDPRALEVLRSRAEGKEAEDIRSQLSLTRTEYATVCRRIARRFAQYSLTN